MQIDKTTYEDLSLFNHEEEFSVFHKLNFTRTRGGRDWLFHYFNNPFSDLKHITETQNVLQLILANEKEWPVNISNGTIMVMERFYETSMDEIPFTNNIVNATSYKIFHGPDYSITRYSVEHFIDFIHGMNKIIALFNNNDSPQLLRTLLERARFLMNHEIVDSLSNIKPKTKLTVVQNVYYGHYIRNRFRNFAQELITIYGKLDAWYSMAMATKKYGFAFPEFINDQHPSITIQSLYHILLPTPIAYDVYLNKESNFFFLTGANMAGKSTFIKAVGTAVFLAHLGMGVPAKEMQLTLFDGILSNINVVDNIMKGESYFFNE